MKNKYTQNLLKAIEKNPEQVEEMLKYIVETPYQSENGGAWVNKDFAEAVCTDLLEMALVGNLSPKFDYKQVSHLEGKELLTITW